MTTFVEAHLTVPRTEALQRLEWWGAAIVLLILSSAFIPLLLAGPGGGMDDGTRTALRLMAVLAGLLSAALIWLRPGRLVQALERNLAFAALLLLPFVSAFWSINSTESMESAVALLLGMLLPYLVAIRFTPRQFLRLLAVVLGACMAASLLLMVASPGLAFMPGESNLRGVFLHKNVLGWAASLSCIVAAGMIRDPSRRVARWARALLLASLACVVMSGSATALLSLVAAIALTAFHLVLRRSRGLGRVVVLLVSLQLAGILLFFLNTLLVPVLEALGKDATLTGRVPLWAFVDAEIARHRILGVGYRVFWTEGSAGAWNIWIQIGWMAPHAHNGYRDMLLSFGLAGMAPLALVLVQALYQGARLQLAFPGEGWMCLNVLVGVFLTMNLTESLFLEPGALPWIVFASAVLMFSTHASRLRHRSP